MQRWCIKCCSPHPTLHCKVKSSDVTIWINVYVHPKKLVQRWCNKILLPSPHNLCLMYKVFSSCSETLSPHIIMWYNVMKCIIESKLNPTMWCKVWIVKWNIYIMKWKSKRKILALSSTFWSAHRVQLLWDISTSSTATLCQGQSCHISYFVPANVGKKILNLFPIEEDL